MMTKKEQRQQLIKQLKQTEQLSESKDEEAQLLEKFYHSEQYKDSEKIAVTLSSGFEFETAPLIEQAWQDGKQIYIPKTWANHRMTFHLYQPKMDLERSSFGILEPKDAVPIVKKDTLDLIIVPGLGFDVQTGYRIGFGGGFYDRYLADYSGRTVAFVRNIQKISIFKEIIEPTDIPVQQLILLEN